jgi:hypothetical protein
MRSERRNLPEQERSIKDREHELFVEPTVAPAPQAPLKPFAVYLRETAADPLSTEIKVVLWIVAVVVLLVFAAALWKTQRASRSRPPRGAPRQTALIPSPRPNELRSGLARTAMSRRI